MMKKFLLGAAVVWMGMGFSQAGILELRAGAGMNAANPDAFEDRVNAVSNQDLKSDNFDNFNADIFINFPVLPLGVGVRHEWLNNKESSGGEDWKIKANNLAVLVDWRFIDTIVYVGPIVSVGYPWADVDFNGSADRVSDQIQSDQLSYSGGAELGVKFGGFIIGTEAGYQSLKFKNVKSQNGNVNSKLDLSGFYGKVMLGITFL